MGVNSIHPQYSKNKDKWQTMRDALSAEVAKEKYVPKLSDQDAAEYQAYVGRAEFYNATARTKTALVGLLFAKPPKVELPEALKSIGENISLDDDSLEASGAAGCSWICRASRSRNILGLKQRG